MRGLTAKSSKCHPSEGISIIASGQGDTLAGHEPEKRGKQQLSPLSCLGRVDHVAVVCLDFASE